MNSATQAFLGRYRLVKVLGQGAMGVVYEAVDTRLNRSVAIKTVLRSHLVDDATASEYTQRFEREAQAAARLSHPHVVAVYDFGEHEDISYIVMEFIRGRELNQVFESGERVALPEAIRMMRELLEALDYAHRQGVVHRDIKPANVMLDAGDHVKLTDFGVARVANANQDRTMPGTLVGTPSYMSPEQILGTAVGSRADIFAAGVILYQFLTGRKPFSGGGPFAVQRKIVQDDPEPVSALNPDVPPGFDLIVSRALAKQPEDRYESAAAFSADLARIGGTLAREVPLIDLELDGASPAAPPPAQSGRPPGRSAPPPAGGLTFDTVKPFGAAAPAPVPAPAAPAPAPADIAPFDPETTVILRRSAAADGTAGAPGALRPVPPDPAPRGLQTAAGGTSPLPVSRAQPGESASSLRQAAAPMAAGAPGAAAASAAGAVPVAPAASAAPGKSAVTVPPGTPPAAGLRPAAAAPRPMRAAASSASSTPRPAPSAAAAPGTEGPRRSRTALALGAAVPVLALGLWLALARPWVPAPERGPGDSTAPSAPAATSTTPAGLSTTPAAAGQPGPAGPQGPTAAAQDPPPAAAPATATPTAAEPPGRGATPATASPKPGTPEATAAPKPAPAEAPAAAKAPRRQTPEAAAQRPEPSAPAAGVATRCSDLLQRMQLGEPLTAEQTTFFQSRCTR